MPMEHNPGVPALVDYQQTVIGQVLNPMAPANDKLTWMYRRYLLQKAISVFQWKLPATWSKNYFLYVLYCFGRVAVVNTDRYGVIPQACGLFGYNVFYQPTNAIITNPLLTGTLQPRIGTECTVLRLQPDYGGIMDLINYYANQMAQCAMSINVNLVNSRVAYAFYAAKQAQANAYYKAFDQVSEGKPAVVLDKTLLDDDGKLKVETFLQDVKGNYIADQILTDMRKIEAQYDTDIGIPNANTDKRERLITDEVNANNVETYSKCALWLEELQETVEQTRQLFDLSEDELSVDWREIPGPAMTVMEEVDTYGTV